MAKCSAYLYYLMQGLEALPPFSCPADAFLWRGVSRRVANYSSDGHLTGGISRKVCY